MKGVVAPRSIGQCRAVARRLALRLGWCGAAVALATAAQANEPRTYALIWTIGNYDEPSAKLQGMDEDARRARDIAVWMGARGNQQVLALSDKQLDFFSMRHAVQSMRLRLKPGDTLFVYFSGHGKRRFSSTGTSGCQEGLVAVDGRLYLDVLLRADLEALAEKAARVVVFNDSCHSGGAITKSFRSAPAEDEMQTKSYPVDLHPDMLAKKLSPPDADAADAACARASNAPAQAAAKTLRSLAPADKLVYLAAAAEDQVAFTNAKGSLATRAWHHCLGKPGADLNQDGLVSGRELAICAQGWLNAEHKRWPQRITVQMNADLPVAPAVGTVPR